MRMTPWCRTVYLASQASEASADADATSASANSANVDAKKRALPSETAMQVEGRARSAPGSPARGQPPPRARLGSAEFFQCEVVHRCGRKPQAKTSMVSRDAVIGARATSCGYSVRTRAERSTGFLFSRRKPAPATRAGSRLARTRRRTDHENSNAAYHADRR